LKQFNNKYLKLFFDNSSINDIIILSKVLSEFYFLQSIQISPNDPEKPEEIPPKRKYKPDWISREEKKKKLKEKKIKEEKYTNLNEFSNEFETFINSNLELNENNYEKQEKIKELNQLYEKTKKEIEEMQKNIISQNKNISINDKPMTQKDKMALANYIRCLPEDQLKGIINLLDKNSEVEIKKGYYELDIEKLSDHKLRELEKYVKSCMKSSKNFIPLRYQDEFNQKKKFEKEKNKENSIDNSNNKQNNINEEKQNEKNDDINKDNKILNSNDNIEIGIKT
jgi:hypothetical protein